MIRVAQAAVILVLLAALLAPRRWAATRRKRLLRVQERWAEAMDRR